MVEVARPSSRLVRDTSGLSRSMGDFTHSLIQPDRNTIDTARDIGGARSHPVHSASRKVQTSQRSVQSSHDAIQSARSSIATGWHMRDFARNLIHPARSLIQVNRSPIESA
jgi:hypothetical protein